MVPVRGGSLQVKVDVMAPASIGVVVTTYNSPRWLAKVLIGYEQQTHADFRLIIADDGSTSETRDLIEQFRAHGRLRLDHVWHEDRGFRKCAILNKAISQTDCEYLIFTDGDCIPERNFVAVHAREARAGYFLSGGYIKLTKKVSDLIGEDDIRSGRIFDRRWLISQGQPSNHKLWKLIGSSTFKSILNAITPTAATWNGMNSSGWTRDLRGINGFNEDMQYGGLDREFGERLWNSGIKSRQIRYSAICLHLDHERSYRDSRILAKNKSIRGEVRRRRSTWAANGIIKDTDGPVDRPV